MSYSYILSTDSGCDLPLATCQKLDVHVLRQARNLGLVRTNAATMRTALEITARLAEAFPGDPCRGDFALYGLGIDEE